MTQQYCKACKSTDLEPRHDGWHCVTCGELTSAMEMAGQKPQSTRVAEDYDTIRERMQQIRTEEGRT